MRRISNIKAYNLVNDRLEFAGNNTFGEWDGGAYKVYSYGYHFPIYAWKDGLWYRNIDKYSVTTSKHKSQLRPAIDDFVEVNTEQIKEL